MAGRAKGKGVSLVVALQYYTMLAMCPKTSRCGQKAWRVHVTLRLNVQSTILQRSIVSQSVHRGLEDQQKVRHVSFLVSGAADAVGLLLSPAW